MSRKLLVIAFYWPPAGGPGVQRWLGFLKYLPTLGFDITLVIPQNADYPVIDTSLLNSVPESLTIIRVPVKEPSRVAASLSRKRTKQLQTGIISKKESAIQKFLLWVRGNFFIPDARVGWKPAVLKALEDYLKDNKEFTVITTGPPHSVHLIGLAIKRRYKNIKWLADFRDPWTTIGYHKELKLTNRAANKHKQLELEVLNAADSLITTSDFTAAEFKSKTQKPICVITNGYDIDVNVANEQPQGKFTLAHVGTLLSDRNPQVLWSVLQDLIQENTDFKSDFQLILAGNVSADCLASINEHGLMKHLDYKGYISHDEATRIMFQSQVLLLIEINSPDTKAIIPGKIFEYLASRRPIIAIGPQDADIQVMLSDTNAGSYHNYSDYVLLKKTITNFYDLYKSGTNSAILTKKIESYHRGHLTSVLANTINDLWE